MKRISNISKFSLGLFIGILCTSLVFSNIAIGGSPIKLIINNKEINCDSAPQIINGSVLVPARNVAESLGAEVEWDSVNNIVRISNREEISPSETTSTGNTTVPNTTSLKDNSNPQDIIQNSVGWDGLPRTMLNGMEALTYKHEIYVNLHDAVKFYKINGVIWNKNDNTLKFPLYFKSLKLTGMSDSDLFIYQGKTYIKDRIVRIMVNEKLNDDYDNFKEMFRVKEIGKPDSSFRNVEIDLIYSGNKSKDDFLKEWLSISQDTKDSYGLRYAKELGSHRNDCIITFLYNDETVLGEINVNNGIASGSLIPNPK